MSDARWFIRFAGQKSGPFDLHRLRTLARRGTLTRMHSISSDGVSWSPVSSLRGVFDEDGTAAAVRAPASDLAEGAPEDVFASLSDVPLPAEVDLPRPAIRARVGTARVRPAVLCALAMATVMLCLPTSRDEAGDLAWWWSEGPLSISLRGLAGAAVLAGWFIALLAPEPARGATVAGVAALLSATTTVTLASWAPWAAFLAPIVALSAVLVALDSAGSTSLRTVGWLVAIGATLLSLAAAVMVVLYPSGWGILAASLGALGGGALAWAGAQAGSARHVSSGRVFWGCVAAAIGAMASLFATAFGGLALDVAMHGASAATAACLVLSYAVVSWAAVHETLESTHLLPKDHELPRDGAALD
jgi:hypothetical protein